jgi:hypothetical protein
MIHVSASVPVRLFSLLRSWCFQFYALKSSQITGIKLLEIILTSSSFQLLQIQCGSNWWLAQDFSKTEVFNMDDFTSKALLLLIIGEELFPLSHVMYGPWNLTKHTSSTIKSFPLVILDSLADCQCHFFIKFKSTSTTIIVRNILFYLQHTAQAKFMLWPVKSIAAILQNVLSLESQQTEPNVVVMVTFLLAVKKGLQRSVPRHQLEKWLVSTVRWIEEKKLCACITNFIIQYKILNMQVVVAQTLLDLLYDHFH